MDQTIKMNSKIRLYDKDHNNFLDITIVPPDETSVIDGKIGSNSPMGKALLGQKEGNSLTINVPRGERNLNILKVIN